jgi:sugar phosphate isomerase/epimerase
LARLLAPIQGRLVRQGGRLTTPYGHDLESPLWAGAEIGFLESREAAGEAAAETLRRGWILGVHYPLVQAHAWDWAPFWLAPQGPERQAARRAALAAMAQAKELGASYILFHYPWPALVDRAVPYESLGWKIPPTAQDERLWPRERLAGVSEEIFAELEGASRALRLRVVLELDGPNGVWFDPAPRRDLCAALFAAHADLDLCLDTGRLGLLARQHGGDPLGYTRRWLDFTRHVHLHGACWERRQNHLPPLPEHEGDGNYTPAAAIARLVLRAHPETLTVLETDPRGRSAEEAERSMRYCAGL